MPPRAITSLYIVHVPLIWNSEAEEARDPTLHYRLSRVSSVMLLGRDMGLPRLLAPNLLTGGKGADLVIRGNVVLNISKHWRIALSSCSRQQPSSGSALCVLDRLEPEGAVRLERETESTDARPIDFRLAAGARSGWQQRSRRASPFPFHTLWLQGRPTPTTLSC
jgi:hypothetical protein